MSQADSRAQVVRDLEGLKALFVPDAHIQGVLGAGLIDKVTAIWRQLIEGLGIQLAIEELIADGERVAVRYTERGVFRGPFMGAQPTGKTYALVAIEWFVVRDGVIQRRWAAGDAASQARQIGFLLP
jgi:hypothetical protein